ncbi:hypothetical protein Tco_1002352 [Tanacetum coccineum]|uniref:Syntaxin 6 N-terminal domain-containing protein n=1 Tax=Tanacetum coccineum TaxID=301880 RepID=A0ABQ5F747_9ASTR
MPLGYRAAMDRWRTASPSTCHPLLLSEIPSLSSPPSLLTSSSSPPLSLLPSLSHKRSRSPSPSLPLLVLPSPLPIAVPPPKHIESVRDDIEASVWDLERHLRNNVNYEPRDEFCGNRADCSPAMANVIETIAIYKAKTRVARDLMNRVEWQKDKVAENTSNKRKWEGDHGGSSIQQQNKEHKLIIAHIAEPSNKKGYAGNLPLCNKRKFHHTGPCAAKCGNCLLWIRRIESCSFVVFSEVQAQINRIFLDGYGV